MRNLWLCLALMCCVYTAAAQDTIKIKKQDTAKSVPQDSTRRSRRNFDSTLLADGNTLTRSDYLASLEKIFQILNKVPVVTASFSEIDDITGNLNENDSATAAIKDRLSLNDRTLNLRNLQMFSSLLEELNENVKEDNSRLEKYDEKLDKLKKEMLDFRKDTVVRQIFRDSALRASFIPQLQQLRAKWKNADSLIRWNTTTINNLKAQASANTIAIQELTYQTNAQLKAVGPRAFGKERKYLWETQPSAKNRTMSRDGFRRSIQGEKKIVKYYFENTRSKRFWLLLTGLIFFYWVVYNFRSLKRLGKTNTIDNFHFQYINPLPILVSFVFILNLAPLFDLHAPASYIESTQLLLMIALTALFWKRLPKYLFYQWGIFILLFLLMSFSRLLGLPIFLQRWYTLILNGVSVAFGIFFMLRLKKSLAAYRIILFAAVLYAFFNLLAIFCNLFGRVTLSQIFSSTAVYSFAQTVSLIVFTQLVSEAFLLQIQSSRIRKNYPEYFDYAVISKGIYRFTIILSVIIWVIVFSINLNIYVALNDIFVALLTEPRSIGSFSFTLAGVVLFLGIIWIANFMQKYIAYFFGDTGDDASFDNKGQRSRLLVTRLILLTAGFLLAVAASGLPVDKITVILGALGVGIGLGLQGIVNNFVSGIILIFDRPLRIGDTVEVGDKKGRVKEIGVRSSTLLTPEGAEVIIPNGDVLSHNIVNWTLSNNHIRIELPFSVNKPVDLEEIKQSVKAIVQSNPYVLPQRPPEILTGDIAAETADLKLYFWCKDVNHAELVRSEVQAAIYQQLEKKGVKFS